jgi:hypothetical protein
VTKKDMFSFQEVMIGKVVELLSVLKKDYCSKNYIEGLLTPLAIPGYPQTPNNPSLARTPFLPTFSSNQSKPKVQGKKASIKKIYSLVRNSPTSNISKPTYKGTSVSKTKNRSSKAISTKTQKKKRKISKSGSKKRKNKSGSPFSYKEGKDRYMSALKYVNPNHPGRFWLTGTLGRSRKRRKVRKKSNSLNMKQKNKKQLSLSHIKKEDMESVWGYGPGRQSKVIKVDLMEDPE